MNLEHIAISVNHKDEIKDFYIDTLGMEQVRCFDLQKELAKKIFGFYDDLLVYILNNEDLTLEIFILNQEQKKSINHICFSISKREELIAKAQTKGYECIQVKREPNDLVFIKDKSGNIFEIKNN